MQKLSEFGTASTPLHPSGIRSLVACNWRAAIQFLAPAPSEGGPAADTGSAMHVAAAEYHRGKPIADCVEAMGTHASKYPQADLSDAAGLFFRYVGDARNNQAKVVCIEEPIAFNIEPAPEDLTRQPIAIIGTLDQVREVDGKLKLYDIKTSKKKPFALLRAHTMQVAAYCVGASVKLNKRVDPGALILPRQYGCGNDMLAFQHFTWTFADAEHILTGLRHIVARIRAGDIWHMPGDDCEWCPAGGPDQCLPRLKELKLRTQNGN